MSKQKILCDIYKSSKDAELYVYVEFGKGLDALPEPLAARLGKPTKVMSLELTPDRKLARADVGKVMEQVEKNGFYLQMPPSPFQVTPQNG